MLRDNLGNYYYRLLPTHGNISYVSFKFNQVVVPLTRIQEEIFILRQEKCVKYLASRVQSNGMYSLPYLLLHPSLCLCLFYVASYPADAIAEDRIVSKKH